MRSHLANSGTDFVKGEPPLAHPLPSQIPVAASLRAPEAGATA